MSEEEVSIDEKEKVKGKEGCLLTWMSELVGVLTERVDCATAAPAAARKTARDLICILKEVWMCMREWYRMKRGQTSSWYLEVR
jgi:hypothetical protein